MRAPPLSSPPSWQRRLRSPHYERLKSPELEAISRADGPIRDSLVAAPTTQALAPKRLLGRPDRTVP